ncbi:MAG TPA: hypothetical protein VIA06_24965 [Candidatus Dormibacteraeota bacterium]|nr:hypothetical protein [Candidatus Dormibacteraeota bacterium]
MIRREGSGVVVERIEWRARANAGAVLVVGALLVGYASFRVHGLVEHLLVGVLALVLLAASGWVYLQRQTVSITPRELRVRAGRQEWTQPRRDIAMALVVDGMWVQLVLRGRDGRRLQSAGLAYFSARELRQALARQGVSLGNVSRR